MLFSYTPFQKFSFLWIMLSQVLSFSFKFTCFFWWYLLNGFSFCDHERNLLWVKSNLVGQFQNHHPLGVWWEVMFFQVIVITNLRFCPVVFTFYVVMFLCLQLVRLMRSLSSYGCIHMFISNYNPWSLNQISWVDFVLSYIY